MSLLNTLLFPVAKVCPPLKVFSRKQASIVDNGNPCRCVGGLFHGEGETLSWKWAYKISEKSTSRDVSFCFFAYFWIRIESHNSAIFSCIHEWK